MLEHNVKRNYAGGISYNMHPEMELYSIVCASALQPTYYTSLNEQTEKIRSLIKIVSPKFVAQLAVYAREGMYLRKIPLFLTVEILKHFNETEQTVSDRALIRKLVRRVIKRADEIPGILSLYDSLNHGAPSRIEKEDGRVVYKNIRKVPNSIRRGIRDIFESGKFDSYQYAKYFKGVDGISMSDALFLTHPKPKNSEQETLFEEIADGMLEVPYTWEVELSKSGQEGKDKSEVWEELIDSGRLGYMAMLRNLRNFLKEGVSKNYIYKVANTIADPNKIRKSKQLPFRFLSAYRAIGNDWKKSFSWDVTERFEAHNNKTSLSKEQSILSAALEAAVNVSIENVPMFENERVLNAIDVSGSMESRLSAKSEVTFYDIGAMLAMLLQSRCSFITNGMFGDTWKVMNDLPTEQILQATNEIHNREGEVGYSTNGWKVLKWAIDKNMSFDRVMIFTDCQLWDSSGRDADMNALWNVYKERQPKAKLYLFNLNSYGQAPLDIRHNDVYLITGWSDSIFSVLKNIEDGGNSLDEIKEILL